MVNADRYKSEQPSNCCRSRESRALGACAWQGCGYEGPVASDERIARYAEAFRDPGAVVERRRIDGVYPGSSRTARETLSEWQCRAVMAVADAEQAELRAEVERLRKRAEYAEDRALRKSSLAADNHLRSEAAEAKVARVEALVGEWFASYETRHRTEGPTVAQIQLGEIAESLRAALAGPEPESITNPTHSKRRACASCKRAMVTCALYCPWCGTREVGNVGPASPDPEASDG